MSNIQYSIEPENKIAGIRMRIRNFILDVIKMTYLLGTSETIKILLKQLIRSVTSIGANFEEATEGESNNDIIHKLSIVKKETKETKYWLELILQLNPNLKDKIEPLIQESEILVKIFFSIIAKKKLTSQSSTH